jgi:hypothetical protein
MTAPTTDLAAQAGALLDALGTDVAASLRTAGARGYQCSGGRCPVAVYLKKHFLVAYASEAYIQVFDGVRWTTLPTPEPVAVFMRAFDRGDHPDLVLGEVEGWQAYIEGAEAELPKAADRSDLSTIHAPEGTS